jgi:hypothetical protein
MSMKCKKSLLVIGGVVVLGSVLWYGQEKYQQEVAGESVADFSRDVASVPMTRTATVYKEPNCGCCNGYIAELEKQGFSVEVKSTQDMGSVKNQYGIGEDKQSCHTMVIGNYFIEGHVPLVAVEKLLTEKPDIEGIGLPGMPLGTPGMPGIKQAPYEIYQKKGNDFESFMTL